MVGGACWKTEGAGPREGAGPPGGGSRNPSPGVGLVRGKGGSTGGGPCEGVSHLWT